MARRGFAISVKWTDEAKETMCDTVRSDRGPDGQKDDNTARIRSKNRCFLNKHFALFSRYPPRHCVRRGHHCRLRQSRGKREIQLERLGHLTRFEYPTSTPETVGAKGIEAHPSETCFMLRLYIN